MADLIDGYIARLRHDLRFDRKLAERLAAEVEDHLREAADADPAGPAGDAQHRAIARFGAARQIAARCAADSIERVMKRTWIMLLIAVVATWVAMRLRVIWIDDDIVLGLAPIIDRYAFIAAVAVASLGWLIDRRRLWPLAACLAGLVASIAAGFIRADLFAGGAPAYVLLAAAGEVVLVTLLSVHLVGFGQRLSHTATLRRFSR